MTKLQSILKFLGPPYQIKMIDLEDVIYRKLENDFEFEISGINSHSTNCTIYVWSPQREIVGIYSIKNIDALKDILGYLSVKYQNLFSQIQVEREDQTI